MCAERDESRSLLVCRGRVQSPRAYHCIGVVLVFWLARIFHTPLCNILTHAKTGSRGGRAVLSLSRSTRGASACCGPPSSCGCDGMTGFAPSSADLDLSPIGVGTDVPTVLGPERRTTFRVLSGPVGPRHPPDPE
jgi:hypothetical protein